MIGNDRKILTRGGRCGGAFCFVVRRAVIVYEVANAQRYRNLQRKSNQSRF